MVEKNNINIAFGTLTALIMYTVYVRGVDLLDMFALVMAGIFISMLYRLNFKR